MKHLGSVVAVYLVVWGVLFVYVITIATRVSRLRQEVERMKESLEGRTRS